MTTPHPPISDAAQAAAHHVELLLLTQGVSPLDAVHICCAIAAAFSKAADCTVEEIQSAVLTLANVPVPTPAEAAVRPPVEATPEDQRLASLAVAILVQYMRIYAGPGSYEIEIRTLFPLGSTDPAVHLLGDACVRVGWLFRYNRPDRTVILERSMP